MTKHKRDRLKAPGGGGGTVPSTSLWDPSRRGLASVEAVEGFPVFKLPEAELGVVGIVHGYEVPGALQEEPAHLRREEFTLGAHECDRIERFMRARPNSVVMMEGIRVNQMGEEMVDSYVAGSLNQRFPELVSTAYFSEWYMPLMWRLSDPSGRVSSRLNALIARDTERSRVSSAAEMAESVGRHHVAEAGDLSIRASLRRGKCEGIRQHAGDVAAEAHIGFRSFEFLWAARRIAGIAGVPVDVYCGAVHQWDIESIAGDAQWERQYLEALPRPLQETHRRIASFYDNAERLFNGGRGEYPADVQPRLLKWLLGECAGRSFMEETIEQMRLSGSLPAPAEVMRRELIRPIDFREFRRRI